MELAGDAEAFEQFVRESRASLLLSAVNMCGEWHTADDIVQDALVILHRRWPYVEPGRRTAYMRAVMAHLVIHGRRRRARHREASFDALPEVATPQEEEAGQVADRLVVMAALGDLPMRQRRCVYLRYWLDLSGAEIAQALQVPPGTVRSDLARAAVRLRRALERTFCWRIAVGDSHAVELDQRDANQTLALAVARPKRADDMVPAP